MSGGSGTNKNLRNMLGKEISRRVRGANQQDNLTATGSDANQSFSGTTSNRRRARQAANTNSNGGSANQSYIDNNLDSSKIILDSNNNNN